MIYRLAIRLFEADFVSPTITPCWTLGAKVKSVKWEFQQRYIRQEFESDLPFSVRFVGKIDDMEVSQEIPAVVVEDHIVSRYTVIDEFGYLFDEPAADVLDEIEKLGAEAEANEQAMNDVFENGIFGAVPNEVFDWQEYDSSISLEEQAGPIDGIHILPLRR